MNVNGKHKIIQAMEVNASLVGALFTDQDDSRLRVFCFYTNGSTSSFDVPSEANLDSLHRLFARLDMVDKCTSVILEKVVQGRIYVEQQGELFSYTLLASHGNTLPPITAAICELPWKRVWSSHEVEVLELGAVGKELHCYAVRSPVNDVETASIYRSSCAFLNPAAPIHKTLRHPVYAVAGAAAALLVLGASLYLGFGYSKATNTPVVRARPAPETAKVSEIHVQMLLERQISGPFAIQELIGKAGKGEISSGALFRVEGATEWIPLEKLRSIESSAHPPRQAR